MSQNGRVSWSASAILVKHLSRGVQLAADSLIPFVCVCSPVKSVPLR